MAATAVAVGRWEEDRAVDERNAEMAEIFAAVGGRIDSPALSGYRRVEGDCLFYEAGGEPYALQLCFDGAGRVIETADRRGPKPDYESLEATPEDATLRVDRERLDVLLELLSSGEAG